MQILFQNNLINVIFDKSVEGEPGQVEQGEYLLKEIEKLYEENADKSYKILLDLTRPKLNIDASSFKAVIIYKRIVDMKQTERVAVLGKDTFADAITEVAFEKIAVKKVNWFTDRERAMKWLGVSNPD